jgi:serine/threonine protein kinase/tetratricopeptide (TPR) repeat protein
MIGQILGHYRIVEKIGAGGMGEVYRAHDPQLDRDVAIKVLPAGTLDSESARRQFRREALALAKLNHPNIATVHEFSSSGGLDFIAMELIPGSTLGERLAQGPMAEKDLLRLGMQLSESLAVAHEHGIVHRDLKPGNLMTTPDGRLKVLDFGLAQLSQSAKDVDLTQSQTAGSGAITGTLPYMSPEQLRGLPVDPRSDVYAAGAVLYQMAAGRRPFPHPHSPELIGAILHESPDPPSSLNRHVTPGLERIILKALEKEPGRRFQSARELLVALEGVQAGSPGTSARSGRWAVGAGALVALVALVGMMLWLNPGGARDRIWPRDASGTSQAAPAIKARQSVAVLGFKNISGRPDEAWLSTALSEMITTELAAGEQLRAIPGENVARMKINLSLPDADSYGADTLARIRGSLSADHIVLGSYVPLGDGQLRLDLRLQDTSGGDIVLATSVKGDEASIDDLVTRAGATLREKLGVDQVSAAQAVAVRAALPGHREAARHYSIGLQSLRQFDYLRARESIERALSLAPDYAPGHSALAAAWRGLGYDQKAAEEARKANDLSQTLSREERLWIEGQYREITNAWGEAAETYRTLVDFFPDNLDYALRLASAETSAGRGREGLATLSALRQLPPPASDDPRIDLGEAAASASLGDYKKQQALAATAARKADAQGLRLLAAQARVTECSALRYLGQPRASVERCEEARRIFAEAGDRSGVARALNAIAVAHMEQGDLAAATRAYDEALALTRVIGDRKLAAMILNNFAGARRGQVDLAGARQLLEEALANFREIDDKGGVVRSLDNIGIVLMDEGRPAAARQRYEESLAICRQIGNKSLTGYTLYLLGDVHAVQGDLAAATQSHRDALAIRKDIGDTRAAGESHLALAGLAIETGDPAAAESTAREQVKTFQDSRTPDKQAVALGVLARALLAQGKAAEARQAADQAVALTEKTQDTTIRLAVIVDASRVRARSGNAGDVADAKRMLQAAVADATKEGLTGLGLEARLALGEIDIAGGDPTARSRVAALQRDAQQRGFALVARKAAAASR